MIRRNLSVSGAIVVSTVVASVLLPAGLAGAQNQVRCGGEVATMVGTSNDDVLIGTPGRDVIVGLGGDDYIDGFGGDDILCGGKGSDLIIGSDGADTIFGGKGSDEIYGGGQEFLAVPYVRDDTAGNTIFAGAGNDSVFGTDRNDLIEGGNGSDRLMGFSGKDKILGGKGSDHIVGHGGKDNLQGGRGSDVVLGETRDTTVRGGAGTDFCPDLPDTSKWRGCEQFFFVDESNSTLPVQTVPRDLAGGPSNYYVFLGETNGVVDFVGITDDLLIPAGDEQFDNSTWITPLAVTGGESRAIAQYILDNNPSFRNGFNFVDPASSSFDDALQWGADYLAINGLG